MSQEQVNDSRVPRVKKRIPKTYLIFSILILVLLISIGVYVWVIQKNTNSTNHLNPTLTKLDTISVSPTQFLSGEILGQVYWDVPSGLISQSVEKEIKSAFVSFDPKLTNGQRFAVVGIQISTMSANFGSASMQVRDVKNKVVPTDGFEYLLSKKNSTWHVTTGGDKNFCNVLRSMPEDMLEGRRDYYRDCFSQ